MHVVGWVHVNFVALLFAPLPQEDFPGANLLPENVKLEIYCTNSLLTFSQHQPSLALFLNEVQSVHSDYVPNNNV